MFYLNISLKLDSKQESEKERRKEKEIKAGFKKGDKVVYSKYGGTEIKVDGEEYLILSSRDILAVV